MNYAIGYALNVDDLMCNFPIQKIKTNYRKFQQTQKITSKKELASRIWISCVKMVLDDIIENSDTFELPTINKDAEIYIKGYSGEKFKQGRQNGKWTDIDFLNSNFTGYQLTFKYQKAGFMVEKPIYLDSNNKKRITDRVNSGKSYY